MTQIGGPIPRNVTAIVGTTLESYESLLAEHDFIVSLHKFLGGGGGSIELSGVKFYMSGDLFQWLYALGKQGKIRIGMFYPKQYWNHTQKNGIVIERASSGEATSEEIDRYRVELLRSELASELIGLFVQLGKGGATYFRFSPVWANESILGVIGPMVNDGTAEVLDRVIMGSMAGEVNFLKHMLKSVWRTL